MARASKPESIKDKNILETYVDKESLNYSDVLCIIKEIEANIYKGVAPDYHLINLYGIGGKGKSIFLDKLNEILKLENFKQIIYNCDNLRNTKRNDSIGVLLELRNSLVNKYNFEFSNFDLHEIIAMAPYQCRFTNYEEDSASVSIDDVKYWSKMGIKTLVDNFTAGAASVILDGIMNFTNKWKSVSLNQYLSQLEQKKSTNPDNFLKLLRESFILDYNQNVKELTKPLIIEFDTFEDYPFNDIYWLFNFDDAPDYGNGLCHSLDKTVWIFSGRDKLPLKENNGWTSEYFSNFQVLNFNKVDSYNYLVNQKIDTKISKKFFEQTKGEPLISYYLTDYFEDNSLNVTQMYQYLSSLDDDLRSKEGILGRYLRYLQSENNFKNNYGLAKRVRIFSALGFWKKDDVFEWPEDLRSMLLEDASNSSLDVFYAKSLVNSFKDYKGEEIFCIQKNVRELLLTQVYPKGFEKGEPIISDIEKISVLNYLKNKYSNQNIMESRDLSQIIFLVKSLSKYDDDEKLRKLVAYNGFIFKYLEHLKKHNMYEFIHTLVIVLQNFNLKKVSHETLHPILEYLLNTTMRENFTLFYESIFNIIQNCSKSIYETTLVAEYFRINGLLSESKRIYDSLFSKDKLSLDDYKGYFFLLLEYHDSNKYCTFLKSYKDKIDKIEDEAVKKQHNMQLDQLYFSFLSDIEQSDQAVKVGLDMYLNNREELIKNGEYNQFLSNWSVCLSKVGYLDKALEINGVLLDRLGNKKQTISDRLYIADIYNNRATILYKQGMLEESQIFALESIRIREQYLPADHLDLLQSQNNLGLFLMQEQKYKEAIELFAKAYEGNINLFGPSHIKVAKNANNIGLCYRELENYDRSLYYFRIAYNIKNDFYKNKHNPDLLQTYKNFYDSIIVARKFILLNYKETIYSSNEKENRQNCIYIIIGSFALTFTQLLDARDSNSDEINRYAINVLLKFYYGFLINYQKEFIQKIKNCYDNIPEIILDTFNLGKGLALDYLSSHNMIKQNLNDFNQDVSSLFEYFSELKFRLELCYGKL